ncbi:ArsR/SmtB family transcription factor [Lentilactobacillus raoultii]|uniref:ArsR/SmtB family transcription factor n=1 Tax=Lentilactobacillus raoultii TaxID=1987503 RepID=A0ABW3PLT9_9LACO|nr:metalloregulator ArsR/SmtB family transcription factor [Lentilactobacillus raoultii]
MNDRGQAILETLNTCIPIFEMLKDKNRQEIIVNLIEHGPLSVNQLVDMSELSRPAVSHHLKILEERNIIKIKKQKTQRISQVDLTDLIQQLSSLISELQYANQHYQH